MILRRIDTGLGPLRFGALLLAGLCLALMPSSSLARQRPQATQVICVSLDNVYEVDGDYVKRPHSCNFHRREKPATYAYMLEMRRIHWRRWGTKVAVGIGQSLANMTGPVQTTVRLSRPEEVCGHRVFTVAHFKFKGPESAGHGLTLDRRLASVPCHVALRVILPKRECPNIGPRHSDVGLYDIITKHMICGRARAILRRWYHDSSAKDTGPEGWRCAQVRRGRFSYRSYCHRNGKQISFTQYSA